MFCTNCGKEISEVRVCPYCGTKTKLFYEAKAEESVPAKEESAPARVRSGAYKKENNNKTIIIVIVALLAVLLVLGAFLAVFLVNNMDKPEPKDDPGVIITEPVDEPVTVPVNVYGDDIDFTEEGRYIVVSEKCTWAVANEKAKAYGENAHLVTFNSLEEYDFVCNLVREAGIRTFWAGVRVGSVSQWANEPYDVDKKKFRMESVRWLENEPSGYDYNLPEDERIFEDCLGVIDLKERGFLANDVHGTAEYEGYVVEIEK